MPNLPAGSRLLVWTPHPKEPTPVRHRTLSLEETPAEPASDDLRAVAGVT